MPLPLPGSSIETCRHCGKQSYRTRGDAKAAIKRLHPHDNRLRPYQCRYGGTLWHFGHMLNDVVAGKRART